MKIVKRIGIIGILLGFYLVFSGNCIPSKFIKVEGQFLGIATQVQVSDIFSEKLIKNKSHPSLKTYDEAVLDNTLVRRIVSEHSLDAATLYALNRLYQMPKNKQHQDAYTEFYDQIKNGQTPEQVQALKSKYLIFVPGLAYKEDTTTGADFARQRRLLTQLGIENKLIETGEWALALDNAALIARSIEAATVAGKSIIIVSASKGGLETAMALGKLMRPDQLKNVVAWVSVGGILRGSPIADQYLKAPKSWLAKMMLWSRGLNMDIVTDISHKRRSVEFDQLQIPLHIKTIHFVGIPLTAQVHKRIKSRYCSMQSSFGPNDGLTTIPDQITPNGVVVSELGLDHFFKDKDIDIKTLALACLIEYK